MIARLSGRSMSAVLVVTIWAGGAEVGRAQDSQASAREGPGVQQVTAGLDEEAVILDPMQGRPVILKPGGRFRFLVRLGPEKVDRIVPRLQHRQSPAVTLNPQPADRLSVFQERFATVTLEIPRGAPAGLYDLQADMGGRTLVSRCCLKVVEEYKTAFRFVHLSDLAIGDPTAPAFDDRLVEEVNLLAPEFIVATGDCVAWAGLLNGGPDYAAALDYFARFEAPVYLACGDRDPEESYTRHAAQSPLGTFDYGAYHGIILWNNANHPIDESQLDFLRRDLDTPRDSAFCFLISHSDDPAFLGRLAPPGQLASYLQRRRVRLLVTGGSDDWDGREYADRLQGLPLKYVRTHQGSTCLGGRASGVPHYRVLEVDGQSVSYVYPSENGPTGIEHSVPVGWLGVARTWLSSARLQLDIQNSLNRSFDDAGLWVILPKQGQSRPEVSGGTLKQVLDGESSWVCRVGFNLPDKGGLRVVVAGDGPMGGRTPIEVRFEGERELVFTARQTDEGLAYFESGQRLELLLRNPEGQTRWTLPLVRLDGNVLAFRVEQGRAWPVTIPAAEPVVLQLQPRLARVSSGPHLLQVTFLEDPLRRVTTFPVNLKVR